MVFLTHGFGMQRRVWTDYLVLSFVGGAKSDIDGGDIWFSNYIVEWNVHNICYTFLKYVCILVFVNDHRR